MITHINGSQAGLSQVERDLVEEKLVVLEELRNGEEAYACEVKVERSAHHASGEDVVKVDATVKLKGEVFRATATRDTMENALDEVREEITRAIREYRNKKHTLFKKGARKVRALFGKE